MRAAHVTGSGIRTRYPWIQSTNLMTDLEQVEVHSRDIFVRYVKVGRDETLDYCIKPHKNSIQVGIFKSSYRERRPSELSGRQKSATSFGLSFKDRMIQAGLDEIHWAGKCDGGKVAKGAIDMKSHGDGMYALVFGTYISYVDAI